MINRMERPMTPSEEERSRIGRFTTGEAAEYFDCSITTIHKWIKDGCLKAEADNVNGKTGRVGRWYINVEELDRLDREMRIFAVKLRKYMVRPLWKIKK